MKKLLLSFALLLLLTGCNFEAPLTDKPTREIDPSFLGNWFSLADGSPLDVYKLSANEYLVIDDGRPYGCTHTDVAGTAFVSCRYLGNDKDHYGKYAYLAYSVEKDELVLTPLNDSLPLSDKSPIMEIRSVVEDAVKKGTALNPDPKHQVRYKKKS